MNKRSITEMYMHKPCKDCPFTKGCQKGWLGEERVSEIWNAESFVCHKTIKHKRNRKQCAGHMLATHSKAMSLLKLFKAPLPQGKELVFESMRQMAKHHKY